MKNIILSVTLIISVTFVNAQSKKEKAVSNAVEQLRVAMVEGNKSQLEKLVTDKLSYGHSGGKIEDKNSFITNIANGNSDFLSIDLSDQTISVSGKTAIVRHILKAKTNDGGKPGDVHLRILLILQKQSGQWKMIARQAVKIS